MQGRSQNFELGGNFIVGCVQRFQPLILLLNYYDLFYFYFYYVGKNKICFCLEFLKGKVIYFG